MKKKATIFPGWLVVLACFMANLMATGISFYSFNAWLQPICELRGWSRTAVNIAPSLGVVIGLFMQIFYGRLIRKYGAKPIMLTGAFIAGLSFSLIGQAKTLISFYLFASLMFISTGAFNGIVPNTAVSYWFEKKRGKALGIATAGISLSGFLVPPLALFLLKKFNLEMMFIIIGALVWILVISFTALLMKKKPEDYGMLPDGIEPGEKGETGNEARFGQTRVSALSESSLPPLSYFLRTQSFWLIGLCFGLIMMPVVGVMIQLKPRFSDIGFSDQTAMAMMALTALIGTAGKYAWARLCDSFDNRKVVAIMILCQILGLIILLTGKSPLLLVLFIVLFGFGMGGVMSTFPVVVANFFGRDNFPKVYGYIAIFLLLQIGGYLLMGRSFDILGSYNYAYIAFIVINSIAIILILFAKKPKLI